MSEWEPATEAEAAMREALKVNDQEQYFRILARGEVLLPVAADALGATGEAGWGTWTTEGRTHVLGFTSPQAFDICLAGNAGSFRRVTFRDLAMTWPNVEWWLAVNPGLPIEGYLPSWFVTQISRGDVRLPGRTLGARARIEHASTARARAVAQIPLRTVPTQPPLSSIERARRDADQARDPAAAAPRARADGPEVGEPAVARPQGNGAPANGGVGPSRGYTGAASVPQNLPPAPTIPQPANSGLPTRVPGATSGRAQATGLPPREPEVTRPGGLDPRAAGQAEMVGREGAGLVGREPSGQVGREGAGLAGREPLGQAAREPLGPLGQAAREPLGQAGSEPLGLARRELEPPRAAGMAGFDPSGPGGPAGRAASDADLPRPGSPGGPPAAYVPPPIPPTPSSNGPAGLPRRTPGSANAPTGGAGSAFTPTSGTGSSFAPASGGGTGFAPTSGGGTGFAPTSGGGTGFAPTSGGGTGFAPTSGGGTAFPPTSGGGTGDANRSGRLNAEIPFRERRFSTAPPPGGYFPSEPVPPEGYPVVEPTPARGQFRADPGPFDQPSRFGQPEEETQDVGQMRGYYRDEPDSRSSSSPPSNVGRATAPEPGDAQYSSGFFADSRPSRAREFFNDVEPPHERELFGDVAAPPRQGSRGQASAPPTRDPRQEPVQGPTQQGPTQQGPTQDETAREAASWPRREPGRSLGELFDVPPVEHAEPIVPAGWRPPPVPPSTPAPAPPATQPASSAYPGSPAYPTSSAYPTSPAHPASSAYPTSPAHPASSAYPVGPEQSASASYPVSAARPGDPSQPPTRDPLTRDPLSPPPEMRETGIGGYPQPGVETRWNPTSGPLPRRVPQPSVIDTPVVDPAVGQPEVIDGEIVEPEIVATPTTEPAYARFDEPPVDAVIITEPSTPPYGMPAQATRSEPPAPGPHIDPPAPATRIEPPPPATRIEPPPPAREVPHDAPARESQKELPRPIAPANSVEESLQEAAEAGSTDRFLSTLLLARVLIPGWDGEGPVEPAAWGTSDLPGGLHLIVFTSHERMAERLGADVHGSWVKFTRLIRSWPGPSLGFAVNPDSQIGATLPGDEVVQLASWAAESGLGGDEPEEAVVAPAADEPARPTFEPQTDDGPVMMQKPISPEQLSYYLERGYDRVSGFVHRAGEVAHLRAPEQLYRALGLNYAGSSFNPEATEAYVLRWRAYRANLYRIPYGGPHEAGMRAMEGWVIERPPFRGNGFAPSETNDVIAEFKVDSARLPHNAQIWRLHSGGQEELIALLDADGPRWRPAGES